jgi:hypothetical protein
MWIMHIGLHCWYVGRLGMHYCAAATYQLIIYLTDILPYGTFEGPESVPAPGFQNWGAIAPSVAKSPSDGECGREYPSCQESGGLAPGKIFANSRCLYMCISAFWTLIWTHWYTGFFCILLHHFKQILGRFTIVKKIVAPRHNIGYMHKDKES